jgi:hypothetical protein
LTADEYGSSAPLLVSERGEYSKKAGESKTVGESKMAGESKMVGESITEGAEAGAKVGESTYALVDVAEESASVGVEMESVARRLRRAPPGLSSSAGDDSVDGLSFTVVSQVRLDFARGGCFLEDGEQ